MIREVKSGFHIGNPEDLADEMCEAMTTFINENHERSEETAEKSIKLIDDIRDKYYGRTSNELKG